MAANSAASATLPTTAACTNVPRELASVEIGDPGSSTGRSRTERRIRPSRNRSTTTDPIAPLNGTDSIRPKANARRISPARAGSRLFAMKAIVTAPKREFSDESGLIGSRRKCQRIARIRKLPVVTATAASSSQKLLWRM
jgi:hypothetical protein